MKVSLQIQGFNGVVETIPEEVELERVATLLGLRGSTPSMLHKVVFPDHDLYVLCNFVPSSTLQPYYLTFHKISTDVRVGKVVVDMSARALKFWGMLAVFPHPATLILAEHFKQAGPILEAEFPYTAGMDVLESLLGYPPLIQDPALTGDPFEHMLERCVDLGFVWVQVSDRPPHYRLM